MRQYVQTDRHPKQRFTIRAIPHGIEIAMPSIPGIWGKLSGIIVSIGCIIGGGYGVVILVLLMLTLIPSPLTRERWWSLMGEGDVIGILIGMLGSGIVGIAGCLILAKMFSKNTLTISQTTLMKYNGVSGRKQTYDLRHIQNIRYTQDKPRTERNGQLMRKASAQRTLLLEYGKGNATQEPITPLTIPCCERINPHEAEYLVTVLSDLLSFHCHVVTCIIFGSPPRSESVSLTTLLNPDVSALTTPFFHLHQVVIYADSYDFHHVERFLTYAINYMGQEYLKHHVDVLLYGDMKELHPNLRNNLVTICQRVSVQEHEPREIDEEAYKCPVLVTEGHY
jgi:hypothetical protein